MPENDDSPSALDTQKLWARLFKAPSVDTYLHKHDNEMIRIPFAEYITALCAARGEAAERIIKRAGLERSFGHQLFRGTRNPSRDTVLQLAFGFECDVQGAQVLLQHARHSPLYPRIPRDAAISYCLEYKYSFLEAQHMLAELALPALGSNGGNKK
ncbi:MAG: hypothetical protein LBM74_09855 [Oscillospiraceae bacterium]|jgi:hypothetical protein|nr:hypothetical protein [Oscillospiraceae bacterium]